MDEQKPEEMEGRIPVTDAPQPPEEVKYVAPEASPVPEEVKYEAPEASQPIEEVKPQVIGAAQPPEDRASGMAISSMVVGIIGILCSWVIFFSIPLGVAALVLGILEFKKIKDGAASEKGRGMAIAGIILGGLTLAGAIIYIIVIVVSAVSFTTIFSSMMPSIMEKFGTFY
jgi:hypothetical protein